MICLTDITVYYQFKVTRSFEGIYRLIVQGRSMSRLNIQRKADSKVMSLRNISLLLHLRGYGSHQVTSASIRIISLHCALPVVCIDTRPYTHS
jgi:hypothetical protein